MLKRFFDTIGRLRWFRHYVILDGRDNSVTFSRALWRHIRRHTGEQDRAQAFLFRIPHPAECLYAFTINPDLGRPSVVAEIQYNDRHRTIGFEALCPTVARILNDHGLPAETVVRLAVAPERIKSGMLIYMILPPK